MSAVRIETRSQIAPTRLTSGLRCLRCDAFYASTPDLLACPACLAAGVHVSLRAEYAQFSSGTFRQPYAQPFSLGEGNTPCTPSSALAADAGVSKLWIKDESQNPTGSHKDRMSAIGITQALEMDAHTIVLASSGNAAISAARYAQAAGLRCEVAAYDGLPRPYANLLDQYGAIRHAFSDNAQRWAFVRERAQLPGYLALTNFNLPALGSAPLAIEGYKLIAQECFNAGAVPTDVVVPTARGDLAWGIFAGFRDLHEAGCITQLPRIWIIEPFARLTKVLDGSNLHANYPDHTAQFSTAGATVTYLQYQAATASLGGAVVVRDEVALVARQQLHTGGISAELCAAAAFAAMGQLRLENKLSQDARVLWLLTASASLDPSFKTFSPS